MTTLTHTSRIVTTNSTLSDLSFLATCVSGPIPGTAEAVPLHRGDSRAIKARRRRTEKPSARRRNRALQGPGCPGLRSEVVLRYHLRALTHRRAVKACPTPMGRALIG